MKKYFSLLILNSVFLILSTFSFSQSKKNSLTSGLIDSLQNVLKTIGEDTSKVNTLTFLTGKYINIGAYQAADSAAHQAMDLAKKLNYKKGLAISYGQIGVVCYYRGDYSQSLDSYFKTLKTFEELGNKSGIATSLGNIGIVYDGQGDKAKALDFYFKALKISEQLADKKGIARDLGYIGIVYDNLTDYPKALEYYFKALKITEELGYKIGTVRHLGNIGTIYDHQGAYTKALEYYSKALKMAEECGDKNGMAINIGNTGDVFSEQKNYHKALEYYLRALKMAEELGSKNYIAVWHGNIGSLYTTTGKFADAEKHLKKAIAIDDSIGEVGYLRQFEGLISQLYDTTAQLAAVNGKFALAVENYGLSILHFKKAIRLKDTLFSQENKKQLVRKEMNFEFDKKEAVTKAAHDKEIAVADAERKQQQVIIWSVIGGLLLVVVFSFFMFNRWRIAQQQKKIIEKQKEKIIDSITYAQRIQQSILMEESEIRNYLPDSFIFYQPKDIVSGDFYWCSKTDDKIILAALDCTGHGVPGAFMSMIGNTLLNQIVNEKHITKPSEVLRLLNQGVYEALHQKKHGALSRDGMDVALCCIDYENNELQFAGAQNPLYVLSDNTVRVIKADLQTVGGGGLIPNKGDAMKIKYTNNIFPLKKGMSIYLFSDGYMDQFGACERKKFGIQKFKELLLNNQHLSMQKQKELIASAQSDWKGNAAQIDDMLVIGVRI